MDAAGLLLGQLRCDLLGNLVLRFFDGLNQRALQAQTIVAGVDDQTAGLGVFRDHVGVVIKAQQDDLLCGFGLCLLPLVHSVPIAEAQVVALALGAGDHYQADLGLLGQLHAAIGLRLGGGLALQVKHGGGQQRRAYQFVQDVIEIFGVVVLLEGRNGLLDLRIEGGCFGEILFVLFGHGSIPHFNFIALMASRR